MIYPYDEVVPLPVRDLYDSGLMQLSIATAKDMYDNARQDLKDFYKEYGDFYSPIPGDMDWYQKNVLQPVRDGISNLYASGVDPLRSAEGRSFVAQLVNNAPVGEINIRKQAAENAKEFLKEKGKLEAQGLYDPKFERSRHGGHLLEDWDTERDGMWTSTSPGIYQDYNTWTHHLFDDMDLSFDEEETKKHPGYLAYTKSRDTMSKIVDTNIAALLNSDLGKYRLQEILDTIPEGTPNRDAIAVEELKRRVIDSNWEEGRVKLEQDPYALARYQNRLRGSGGGGYRRQPQTKLSYNWMNGMFQRGLTNAFGYDARTGEETALNNIMSDQIGFGQQMRKGTFNGPWAAYKANSVEYVNKFTHYENPMMFAGIVGRKMDNEGGVPLTRADLENLRTQADVVTHTYGYPYKQIQTNKDNLKKQFNTVPVQKETVGQGEGQKDVYNGIVMVPYQDVYTSYQRYGQNGAVDQQWKVAIINKHDGKHLGDYWYSVPNTREYNIGIPGIGEWVKNSEGRYEIPNDINGNPRGLAKAGINSKIRGANERASWLTTGMLGVTQQPFNRDNTYNEEGTALSSYR